MNTSVLDDPMVKARHGLAMALFVQSASANCDPVDPKRAFELSDRFFSELVHQLDDSKSGSGKPSKTKNVDLLAGIDVLWLLSEIKRDEAGQDSGDYCLCWKGGGPCSFHSSAVSALKTILRRTSQKE